jgi:hypothetical protein
MPNFIALSFFWWALAAYLLLVVVSHLAWWSKRSYFPNIHLCSDAHDRFHLSQQEKQRDLGDDPKEWAKAGERFWHVIGLHLISQVPEELSIAGFFCTIAWPVFVLLNILLLAQVVGTQVGEGGGVWEIYPFGTYGAIPLVTATLYAVAQTVAGIMYGESKDKKRYLALLFLVLAILLEGGLAVYRAWLIRGGGTTAGANLVDNSLASQFGVVVGAFFGIFFPATHAALGYVAFPKFVVPIVRYAIRLSGGLLMLVWSAANYLLLAWHSVHPKDYPEWLKSNPQWDPTKTVVISPEEKAHWDDQRRLLVNATALYGDLKLLLDDLPATPATVDKALEESKKLLKHWKEVVTNANQELAKATELEPQASMPTAVSGGTDVARLGPLQRLANSHNLLNTAIKHIRENEIELDQEAKTEGRRVLMLMETCRADLVRLQRRLEEIKAIAHFGIDADGLLKNCETLLAILEETFHGIPEPKPGHFRWPDYAVLKDKVSQCRAAYDILKERWGKEKPVIPPAAELKARRDELDALTNLTQAYTDASKSLYESKQMATERLKRVEGRPRWFYWLADRIA